MAERMTTREKILARCRNEAETVAAHYLCDLIRVEMLSDPADLDDDKNRVDAKWRASPEMVEHGDAILEMMNDKDAPNWAMRVFDRDFDNVRFWMLSRLRSTVRRAQRAKTLDEMKSNPLFGMF